MSQGEFPPQIRTRPIGAVAGIRLHDCDDRRAGRAANSHLPYEGGSASWHMSKLCKIKEELLFGWSCPFSTSNQRCSSWSYLRRPYRTNRITLSR